MEQKIREYKGEKILVRFDGSKCIHSRNCILGSPEVFDTHARPWIQPDNASVEKIVETTHTCPSGAVTYERLEQSTQEKPPSINTIRVYENGPLAIRAEIELDGEETPPRLTLCRCGASNNKPFCDGSHTKASFKASGELAAGKTATLEIRNGKVSIQSIANGPLLLNGPIEICTATGHIIERTTKTALCRCGASNNKPFCDGAHSKIAFKSE